MIRRFSWRATRDLVLSLGFVVVIAIPGAVAAVRGFPWEPLRENRSPAPYPEPRNTPLAAFPTAFERWFADHFAFRGHLVRLSSRLRYAIGVSSAPLTIIGENGWFFFSGDSSIDGFRRTRTLDEAELSAWRSTLVARRDWLAARGSRYLVVVHPNKESVYSEFVPRALNRLPRASATEQLTDTLRSASVEVVDSLEAVLRVKASGREVFARTDTHWNGLGSFAGYRAVAERLEQWFPAIRPMGLDAFHVYHGEGGGGDLSGMLALADVIVEPDRCDVEVANPRARRMPFEMPLPPDLRPHEVPFVMEQLDSPLPRAVVMGDSFMLGVAPFLGEHFSHMLYYGRHDLPAELLERERPDIVIDAWVERFLFRGPPPDTGFHERKPAEDELP